MMEQDVTMDKDFSIMEVCCACLSKNPSHWLINNTAHIYTNITGIKLTNDLPNQMCDSCIKLLKQANDFRTKCIESYEWLIKVRNEKNNQTTEYKVGQGTDINNINIKQEIIVEVEPFIPEEHEGNLFTVKIESLDSDMKDDVFGVKDLDSNKLQENTIEKTINIPLHNILENKEIYTIEKVKKTYKCDTCNYIATQKSHLEKHVRTHTGEKLYKCNICGYSAIQKSTLVRHLKRHTGEKLFKCDICCKNFINNWDLVQHSRTHTGERPYKCETCQYSATQKSNLARHVKRHH